MLVCRLERAICCFVLRVELVLWVIVSWRTLGHVNFSRQDEGGLGVPLFSDLCLVVCYGIDVTHGIADFPDMPGYKVLV